MICQQLLSPFFANKCQLQSCHSWYQCTLCSIVAGIYDELDAHLESLGLTCECLGGGKIEHNPQEKSITIFGSSQVMCAVVLLLTYIYNGYITLLFCFSFHRVVW